MPEPQVAPKSAPTKATEPLKAASVKKVRIDEGQDDFVVQQPRAQKKQSVKVVTSEAAPRPMATFTPKSQKKDMDAALDEFETVGTKKERFADSDSDDDRIPNSLLVKLSPNKQSLNGIISQAMAQIKENAVSSSVLTDNIEAVVKLITGKSKDISGGWEQPNELVVQCMHVGRDQDTFEESELA